MNVFSWAKLQPYEEGYNFSELDDIVEMLSKENYDIVPATSVEELQKYPEAERIDYEGRKAFHIWMEKKYGTLEALNYAWNMEF